jgi:hypothetical protein
VSEYALKGVFLYYTLGEGFQDNNIYVETVQDLTTQKVKAYYFENRPLWLFNQRMQVPAGYDLYCIDSTAKEFLEEAGLTLKQVPLDPSVQKYRLFMVFPSATDLGLSTLAPTQTRNPYSTLTSFHWGIPLLVNILESRFIDGTVVKDRISEVFLL